MKQKNMSDVVSSYMLKIFSILHRKSKRLIEKARQKKIVNITIFIFNQYK